MSKPYFRDQSESTLTVAEHDGDFLVIHDARDSAEMIAVAYFSARNGCPVSIDEITIEIPCEVHLQ